MITQAGVGRRRFEGRTIVEIRQAEDFVSIGVIGPVAEAGGVPGKVEVGGCQLQAGQLPQSLHRAGVGREKCTVGMADDHEIRVVEFMGQLLQILDLNPGRCQDDVTVGNLMIDGRQDLLADVLGRNDGNDPGPDAAAPQRGGCVHLAHAQADMADADFGRKILVREEDPRGLLAGSQVVRTLADHDCGFPSPLFSMLFSMAAAIS